MRASHEDQPAASLLRAIDELRELDQEARQHPIRSEPYIESVERLAAKSREVFRMAGSGGWEELPSGPSDVWADDAIGLVHREDR